MKYLCNSRTRSRYRWHDGEHRSRQPDHDDCNQCFGLDYQYHRHHLHHQRVEETPHQPVQGRRLRQPKVLQGRHGSRRLKPIGLCFSTTPPQRYLLPLRRCCVFFCNLFFGRWLFGAVDRVFSGWKTNYETVRFAKHTSTHIKQNPKNFEILE